MKVVRNRLRRLRFDHSEMTQEQLASELGVARQTVNSIEKSKFNPSVHLALRMGAVFECSVDDIFYLEEEENE